MELRVRKARRTAHAGGHRGAAAARAGGPRHRRALGAGRACAAALGSLELPEAADVVVLWDEADLAAEPDAAGGARAARSPPSARARSSSAPTSTARACARSASRRPALLEAAQAGEIDVLLTIKADPLAGPGASDWSWALGRVRGAHRRSRATPPSLTDSATVVLPAATHYETEGVYVSMNGRAQRLRPGAPPPEGAAPGWEILIALAHRLGAPPAYRTAAQRVRRARPQSRPALAGLELRRPRRAGRPRGRRSRRCRRTAPTAPATWAGGGLPLVTTTRIFGNADRLPRRGARRGPHRRRPHPEPGRGRAPGSGRRRPRARALAPRRDHAAGARRRGPPRGRRLRRDRASPAPASSACSPPTAARCGSRSRSLSGGPDERAVPRSSSSRPWSSSSCW